MSERTLEDVEEVRSITARFPSEHGAPLHVGDPCVLGISDLMSPDFGDAPVLEPGDVPVFHYCGCTPHVVLEESALPFAITHAPGHMLVLDARSTDLDTGRT